MAGGGGQALGPSSSHQLQELAFLMHPPLKITNVLTKIHYVCLGTEERERAVHVGHADSGPTVASASLTLLALANSLSF